VCLNWIEKNDTRKGLGERAFSSRLSIHATRDVRDSKRWNTLRYDKMASIEQEATAPERRSTCKRAWDLVACILTFVAVEFLVFMTFVFDLCFDSCSRSHEEIVLGQALMWVILAAFIIVLAKIVVGLCYSMQRDLEDDGPVQPLIRSSPEERRSDLEPQDAQVANQNEIA